MEYDLATSSPEVISRESKEDVLPKWVVKPLVFLPFAVGAALTISSLAQVVPTFVGLLGLALVLIGLLVTVTKG